MASLSASGSDLSPTLPLLLSCLTPPISSFRSSPPQTMTSLSTSLTPISLLLLSLFLTLLHLAPGIFSLIKSISLVSASRPRPTPILQPLRPTPLRCELLNGLLLLIPLLSLLEMVSLLSVSESSSSSPTPSLTLYSRVPLSSSSLTSLSTHEASSSI